MKTDKQNKTIVDFDSVLKKIRDETKGNTAEKGRRFENLTKDFFETDKLYKNRFVKVWTWMEFPDRDTRDLGIDLDPLPEPDVELDMDTILDKINKSGMDSLTQEEKDFLYSL